ncbi:unnamed protein product [Camellia sinensis]
MASSIVTSIALVTLLTWAWKVVKWVWLRPKQLEKWLREQGFKGNPYKLLFGDTKEMIPMMKEARSKPIDPCSDDIVLHFLPFHHHCVILHGKDYFQWLGPTPRLTMITMILNEVLRLYSPASYLIRAVHKKTRLGELLVPPGLEFLVPITTVKFGVKMQRSSSRRDLLREL